MKKDLREANALVLPWLRSVKQRFELRLVSSAFKESVEQDYKFWNRYIAKKFIVSDPQQLLSRYPETKDNPNNILPFFSVLDYKSQLGWRLLRDPLLDIIPLEENLGRAKKYYCETYVLCEGMNAFLLCPIVGGRWGTPSPLVLPPSSQIVAVHPSYVFYTLESTLLALQKGGSEGKVILGNIKEDPKITYNSHLILIYSAGTLHVLDPTASLCSKFQSTPCYSIKGSKVYYQHEYGVLCYSVKYKSSVRMCSTSRNELQLYGDTLVDVSTGTLRDVRTNRVYYNTEGYSKIEKVNRCGWKLILQVGGSLTTIIDLKKKKGLHSFNFKNDARPMAVFERESFIALRENGSATFVDFNQRVDTLEIERNGWVLADKSYHLYTLELFPKKSVVHQRAYGRVILYQVVDEDQREGMYLVQRGKDVPDITKDSDFTIPKTVLAFSRAFKTENKSSVSLVVQLLGENKLQEQHPYWKHLSQSLPFARISSNALDPFPSFSSFIDAPLDKIVQSQSKSEHPLLSYCSDYNLSTFVMQTFYRFEELNHFIEGQWNKIDSLNILQGTLKSTTLLLEDWKKAYGVVSGMLGEEERIRLKLSYFGERIDLSAEQFGQRLKTFEPIIMEMKGSPMDLLVEVDKLVEQSNSLRDCFNSCAEVVEAFQEQISRSASIQKIRNEKEKEAKRIVANFGEVITKDKRDWNALTRYFLEAESRGRECFESESQFSFFKMSYESTIMMNLHDLYFHTIQKQFSYYTNRIKEICDIDISPMRLADNEAQLERLSGLLEIIIRLFNEIENEIDKEVNLFQDSLLNNDTFPDTLRTTVMSFLHEGVQRVADNRKQKFAQLCEQIDKQYGKYLQAFRHFLGATNIAQTREFVACIVRRCSEIRAVIQKQKLPMTTCAESLDQICKF